MRLIEGIGRGVILLSYHRYQLSGTDRRDYEKGKTVPKQPINHRHVYLRGTKALSLEFISFFNVSFVIYLFRSSHDSG